MWRIQKRYHFFDAGSFTPLSKRAYRAMKRVATLQQSGKSTHPSSAHRPGQKAYEEIQKAQQCIAALTKVKSEAVLLTSGATEANERALIIALAKARARSLPYEQMQVVTSADEHPSWYQTLDRYAHSGVHYLCVGTPGEQITPAMVADVLSSKTVLVSLSAVVSTHGLLRDSRAIARKCREISPDTLLHSDATQAAAYYPIGPEVRGVDMVTIDSAKVFGPQGAGALIGATPGCLRLPDNQPLRPGTPSVMLHAGSAAAFKEAVQRQKERFAIVRALQSTLIEALRVRTPEAYLFGIHKRLSEVREKDLHRIAPHLLYLSFPQTQHDYLAVLLDAEGYAVSTGTACSGLKGDALRIGLHPALTKKQVHTFASCLHQKLPLARLRF